MPLHISSTRARQAKIVLYSLWYHHTETSEWSKITKIQFCKYEHMVVKFMYEFLGCDYCVLLNPLNAEINPICHLLALFGAHHILDVSR